MSIVWREVSVSEPRVRLEPAGSPVPTERDQAAEVESGSVLRAVFDSSWVLSSSRLAHTGARW